MTQGTDEWRALRAGKITASRACDVLAFGKRDGKPLQARRDYVGDIVGEILTGEPKAQVRARPLDWGHDVEAAARAAYEADTGAIVELADFLPHPLVHYAGCSPDGLVGTCGQIEIKCPSNPAVHAMTLRDGMPAEHVPQIQFEMWVTGRAWCDFVSYDPRMPEHARLYIQRIERDQAFIDGLAVACESMWAEVQEMLEIIGRRAA